MHYIQNFHTDLSRYFIERREAETLLVPSLISRVGGLYLGLRAIGVLSANHLRVGAACLALACDLVVMADNYSETMQKRGARETQAECDERWFRTTIRDSVIVKVGSIFGLVAHNLSLVFQPVWESIVEDFLNVRILSDRRIASLAMRVGGLYMVARSALSLLAGVSMCWSIVCIQVGYDLATVGRNLRSDDEHKYPFFCEGLARLKSLGRSAFSRENLDFATQNTVLLNPYIQLIRRIIL